MYMIFNKLLEGSGWTANVYLELMLDLCRIGGNNDGDGGGGDGVGGVTSKYGVSITVKMNTDVRRKFIGFFFLFYV